MSAIPSPTKAAPRCSAQPHEGAESKIASNLLLTQQTFQSAGIGANSFDKRKPKHVAGWS